MKIKILVMEDDRGINNLIKMHLKGEGYEVVQAFDGEEAIERFTPDISLAILDVMVPEKDGFEVLSFIRKSSEIPVIFLTARGADEDKVLALGMGADDYVTKPFGIGEVISRCKAHLRRYMEYSARELEGVITNGEIRIEKEGFKAYRGSSPLSLSAKEFKLLTLFMENQGRVFTKRQLYEHVWEEFFLGDDNTIMVHISRLREKLEENPKAPEYIKTIKCLGYRMESK
ncbi:DNA-binding response regulator, OmpR family, contains REC and winged-helix (wHTH) domain [Peptoclostridium litorale DSM 5388]|uniref:Stage 0 sporulation protein A homolog n=1 Tax=Peptoclostridium litorale DSM 5388 TaxID=1121324 RepID=A0A069RMV3_PEPLI|nr:response regulator transcription factor [Peptoclostridium litorale]KDR95512.1 transcriptional regulatory protein [Peptoclostridium litorale DSM 5388]SIO17123.1 DNA-binding response regulator, OmpR family, contains REC and winged-helix (wHTH) domain [Peptoclostridium litorale DSM 5388]